MIPVRCDASVASRLAGAEGGEGRRKGTDDSISCNRRATTMGKLSLEIMTGNFDNQIGSRLSRSMLNDESDEAA